MKLLSFGYIKKAFFPVGMVAVVLLSSGCSESEDDGDSQQTEKTALMNQLIGTYQIEGTYGTTAIDSLGDAPLTLTIQKKSDDVLSVSAPGLPAFEIKEWFKGYQSATDQNEYTIFSSTVPPHDGTVSLSFPDAEIAVLVEIRENASRPTRLLSLNGSKD